MTDRRAMTDDEILAYYRQKRGNPYLTLATAKALRMTDLRFGHLGASKLKEERDEQEAKLRRPLNPKGQADV